MTYSEQIACMGGPFEPSVLHDYFEADYENGLLYWKERDPLTFESPLAAKLWNAKFAGKPAGGKQQTGYVMAWLKRGNRRHSLPAHRVLWAMRTGQWPIPTVDHRDHCRSNNRWENLREATFAQQNANRPAIRNGLKGATFDKVTGRWVAQINRDGKNHFLGRHLTEQDAHAAYMAAARSMHGEFASC